MKKLLMTIASGIFMSTAGIAQEVRYEEYDLDNGLHVVLHNDPSAPVVVTSVMYHVGAKDETPDRTGFAHFFEHLLFEGTENIERGEWFKIVTSNGGKNNANTSDDRTYYYEVFPSNNLKLALWMESERMLHPVINQIGVDTQNEVVKEEKRQNVDTRPYGNVIKAVKENMFKKHPYRWTTIGEMDHLDAATLDEFKAFNKKYYIPNNAVLVVAGDFDTAEAKQWISDYFGTIPKGESIERTTYQEAQITTPIKAEYRDENIQIPMMVASYRTPSMKHKDARVLDMISSLLSDGKSSILYKSLVDEQKKALQMGSFNFSQEDYGMYIIYGLPMPGSDNVSLLSDVDQAIVDLQTNLISERDFEKLQNVFENKYVNSNSSLEGVASNLATYYLLYGDISLINKEINIYRSITREEIREVARKYLQPNSRLVLDYLPAQ